MLGTFQGQQPGVSSTGSIISVLKEELPRGDPHEQEPKVNQTELMSTMYQCRTDSAGGEQLRLLHCKSYCSELHPVTISTRTFNLLVLISPSEKVERKEETSLTLLLLLHLH